MTKEGPSTAIGKVKGLLKVDSRTSPSHHLVVRQYWQILAELDFAIATSSIAIVARAKLAAVPHSVS